MPGKEIKGQSKRANYRHGGRTGFEHGKLVDELGPKESVDRRKGKLGIRNEHKLPPQNKKLKRLEPKD